MNLRCLTPSLPDATTGKQESKKPETRKKRSRKTVSGLHPRCGSEFFPSSDVFRFLAFSLFRFSASSFAALGLAVGFLAVGLAGCTDGRFELPRWPGLRPATSAPTTAPAVRIATTRMATDGGAAPAILEPSQGRPIILRPGDRFYFLLRLGDGAAGPRTVTLVHAFAEGVSFPLAEAGEAALQPQKHAAMILQVPADTPDGLYDLRTREGDRWLSARRCVKVVREFRKRFRFVHLSDMHIGDPTAPDFDPRLPEEINLLNPEFIIATGDFMDTASTGRVRGAWSITLEYLARFTAPVYVLCGEEDNESTFSPAVATSPIGSFDYGTHHGILLLNHARRAIDAGQIDFVRKDLADHPQSTFSFLAMNDDDPAVLRRIAMTDSPAAFLQANRVRMLICGGDSDWDGREYAETLADLPGLHYVRTHPASTCRRGRATGNSRYRVIEVDGEDVAFAYPAGDDGPVQRSVPAGGLGVTIVGDGADPPGSVSALVRNSLNQAFADCRVWLRLARRDDAQPRIAGGRLVRAWNDGSTWLCEVSIDLPDRGGLCVAASVDREPPAPLPVAVEFGADAQLRFKTAVTGNGLTYHTSNGRLVVVLRNTSTGPLTLRPVVRLQGQTLGVTTPEQFPWPLRIEAGKTIELPMRLLLAEVLPGRCYVQVSFQEDPLRRLHLHPVDLQRETPATRAAP